MKRRRRSASCVTSKGRIVSFPLDGGPLSRLTDLTGLEVRDFVLDADREWITHVRVDTSSDAVLIESLQ